MTKIIDDKICKNDFGAYVEYRSKLPKITENIISSCYDEDCFIHMNHEPIPSRREVVQIVHDFLKLLFPGYYSREQLDPVNLKYKIGLSVSNLFKRVTEQITNSYRHECFRYDKPCTVCMEEGYDASLKIFKKIPFLKKLLATDVKAIFNGDPAATTYDEIIFSYPGLFAISVYRIAHEFFHLNIPLIPRIMTEFAHSITGIDIHPGAEISESFAIDHGTGIVIGETTEIGKNVRIYQGVTLGALSLPKGAGEKYKGKKRHPTIEDDVIIYSGTTILGGKTTIGARSVIGGNIWITESVPQDTMVLLEKPKLIYKQK